MNQELDNREDLTSRCNAPLHEEPLVLVDECDQEVGFLDKTTVHGGQGVLHRAFSLFVFNERGQLLLQQRAAGKRLWPGYWSNSCCSHPRRSEAMETAIHRRLGEELRMSCELVFQFKFQYQAQFDEEGAEHELCWVYTGHSDVVPVVNAHEIAAIEYVAPAVLDREIAASPQRFTPWFKIEWARLRSHHASALMPPLFTSR